MNIVLNLALTEEEKKILRNKLGREPNLLEWALVDAEWSEHCSYKSSKPVLNQLPTTGNRVLFGPGFDAGVIDIGDGYIVTIHIESHNHPSAIDPYGGAATGIGGVIRDILSVGTRPIALLDSIRFGDIKNMANSRWLFKNVVKGISDYGNCIGVPTVGGEVGFDNSFEKNCLVDVVCVGLGKIENLVLAKAKYSGDSIVIMGGSTGRDGINGVTFASKVLSDESESERSAVQIPNPFLKKLIIEATLESVATGLVRGLKDLGGGGLTSGLSETAYKGNKGMEIEFSKIILRENDMTPVEAFVSESQERMLFIIKKGYEEQIYNIFDKYELSYSNIGRVTNTNRIIIKNKNKVIADLPVEIIASAPIINREIKKPKYIDKLNKIIQPNVPKNLSKIIISLLSSPNLASKKWVYEQYDSEVGIRTVIKPGQAGSSVLRLDNNKYLAITIDGNPRHCYIDPYNGSAGILAESCRNIISVGGEPVAMVDHCQFGDPGNPEVFWTFSESVRGMADYCKAMNLPCVGGKVSFYNEDSSSGVAIKPSPIVSVIGLIENESNIKRMTMNNGEIIILVGTTNSEMGGSEYYEYILGLNGGIVPKVYFNDERRLQRFILESIRSGFVGSLNDCSKGGLAISLAKICISSFKGIEVDIDKIHSKCKRIDERLFSESHGRFVLTASKKEVSNIIKLASKYSIECAIIGIVKGDKFLIKSNSRNIILLKVDEIRKVWDESIPKLIGEEV